MRAGVLAVALLAGLGGIKEYFSLVARDWGAAAAVVPLAALGIPLAGAAGAPLASVAMRWRGSVLGLVLGAAFGVLALMGFLRVPAGLAGVAAFYGLYLLVLVVADARLQHRIEGTARATVTSVAGLGTELGAVVLFGAWALGGLGLVVVLGVVVAVVLPLGIGLRAADAPYV